MRNRRSSRELADSTYDAAPRLRVGYGPLAIVNVHVEEYEPEYALPGTASRTPSVTFAGPLPVAAAALKIFAAAGAVAAAGTVNGYVIELVGTAHVPVVPDADAEVIVEDDVGNVLPPDFVNVVDVSWTFQPATAPMRPMRRRPPPLQ